MDTLETLKAKNEELEKANAALKEELANTKAAAEKSAADAKEVISDLTEKLTGLKKEADKAFVTVTHDKKKYKVVISKFRHNSVEYTDEQLAKAPKVVAELVESNSSVLELVTQ